MKTCNRCGRQVPSDWIRAGRKTGACRECRRAEARERRAQTRIDPEPSMGGHDCPEWLGYIAAFDAYVDARKRGDTVLAEQARRVMGWFAAEVAPVRSGTQGPSDHVATVRTLLDLVEGARAGTLDEQEPHVTLADRRLGSENPVMREAA